jgi:hypothetical protein
MKSMKSKTIAALLLGVVLILCSCQDYETYGDKKAKEREAISRFLSQQNIKVISETTFKEQGETTDTTANEYVYLNRNGVYMQIRRKGCGDMLEEGKTATVLCRFVEYNILADSMLVRNDIPYFIYNSYLGQVIDCSQYVDKMSVLRSGTTFTASFLAGGMMYMYHSTSTSVPTGWLVPLNYINIGRPDKEGEETAKVRLIVPHSQGTADASSSVYPCFYEIQYEQAR